MEKKFIISKVEHDKTSVRPLIVNFQNGKIPSGFENNLVGQVYKDQHNDHVVACAANKMLYTDTVKRDTSVHNTFICVPNKKGTKIKLIAVDYVTLAPKMEEKNVSNDKTYELAVSDLNREFGSKKIKRIIEQRQKLKSNIDTVRDDLMKTVADMPFNEEQLMVHKTENNNEYKPFINDQATNLAEVYVLNDLVSQNVLDSLYQKALEVLSQETDLETCQFVTQQLNQITNGTSQSPETLCQLWLYADCLIKFISVTAKTLNNKKFTSCSYSEVVHKDIFDKFTVATPTGRNRPNIMRDKCLCYLLVICAIASDYKLNLNNLAVQVKIGIKKLQEFARTLRFVVNGEYIILKVPLPPPVVDKALLKKRKK